MKDADLIHDMAMKMMDDTKELLLRIADTMPDQQSGAMACVLAITLLNSEFTAFNESFPGISDMVKEIEAIAIPLARASHQAQREGADQ